MHKYLTYCFLCHSELVKVLPFNSKDNTRLKCCNESCNFNSLEQNAQNQIVFYKFYFSYKENDYELTSNFNEKLNVTYTVLGNLSKYKTIFRTGKFYPFESIYQNPNKFFHKLLTLSTFS